MQWHPSQDYLVVLTFPSQFFEFTPKRDRCCGCAIHAPIGVFTVVSIPGTAPSPIMPTTLLRANLITPSGSFKSVRTWIVPFHEFRCIGTPTVYAYTVPTLLEAFIFNDLRQSRRESLSHRHVSPRELPRGNGQKVASRPRFRPVSCRICYRPGMASPDALRKIGI